MTGPDILEAPPALDPKSAAPPSGTITELVSGIIDDTQVLVHQQIDMLKAEFREDLARTKRAAEIGGLGIVLLTVGGLTLVTFLVNLLHDQLQFSMWGSCLIIGSILLIGGIALVAVARSAFETFNPLPGKTINALQENLTWKTQTQT